MTDTPTERGNETVLVVEDEPAVRTLVQVILARQGYRVLEASTGKEALDVWQKERGAIRLLLTDLLLPDGMNGKELAARMSADDRALRVIYTSGYSHEVAGDELALEDGVNFLSKPYPASALLETVRRALDA